MLAYFLHFPEVFRNIQSAVGGSEFKHQLTQLRHAIEPTETHEIVNNLAQTAFLVST